MVRPDLRPTLSGVRDYLGSVAVAVVLAPVLPDVAVDLFGGGSPQLDATLRLGALAVVLLGCTAIYLARRSLAHRRSRRRILDGIPQTQVLVVAVGYTSTYQLRNRRTGPMSSLEWLVDTATPDIVVAVTSPEVQSMADGHASALGEVGIGYRNVPIADARDPARTVAEADRLVAILRAEPFVGRRITIDTTGGSLPMSLMMMRVAAQVGAACTYVSSGFANRRIVPGSQQGHKFDPVDLIGAASATTAVATDPAPAVPATETSPDTSSA